MPSANLQVELSKVDDLGRALHTAISYRRTVTQVRQRPRINLCFGIATFVLILVIVLVEAVPLLVVPWTGTCRIMNKSTPFGLTMLVLMPLYPVPWFVGCVIVALILYKDQYRRSSEHFWTVCYMIVTFIGGLSATIQVMWRCGSSAIARYVWDVSWITVFTSWMLLTWLSVLKLRLMTVLAPRLMRLGLGASNVLLTCCPILSFLHAMRVHGYELSAFASSCVLIVTTASMCTVCGCVVFSMELSARALRKDALAIETEGHPAENMFLALKRLRRAKASIATAGTITIFYSIVCLVADFVPPVLGRFLLSFFYLIDTISNTCACIVLSGLLRQEGRAHSSSTIINLGVASQQACSLREIELEMTRTVGGSTGSALVIAALMGNASAHDALEIAAGKFRCIRWEVLARRPDVIMGGAPLDVLGPGGNDLYSLSEPCQLGDCDAFFSHSWHDDPSSKWEALTLWCQEFMLTHGRFPRIWLDKVCIDQSNIDVDLQCLPIFLAGCNTMFAASGSTYHKRLWCLVEMLVYSAMLVRDGSRDLPVVWLIGNTSDDCEANRRGWLNFNVHDCECFQSRDKERFLRVVAAYPGGKDRFNRFIRGLSTTIQRKFAVDEV
eukprot:TRINITY_DN8115_c0_g1_i1.p1 TRINITY_DN8115_c0_g1~~TRINITY_DN8115_c0_g1_i1.p1  ORF type:complete len:612 (+),score=62.73 TRINITY_DN8115_c0_g1_i1:79-1914(+)